MFAQKNQIFQHLTACSVNQNESTIELRARVTSKSFSLTRLKAKCEKHMSGKKQLCKYASVHFQATQKKK